MELFEIRIIEVIKLYSMLRRQSEGWRLSLNILNHEKYTQKDIRGGNQKLIISMLLMGNVGGIEKAKEEKAQQEVRIMQLMSNELLKEENVHSGY